MPWGPNGDGAGRTTAGLVILRQILASPAYAPSIANVTAPGMEPIVMGEGLPLSEYTSTAAFEERGCAAG